MKQLMAIAMLLVSVYATPSYGQPTKDGTFLLRACSQDVDSPKTAEAKLTALGLRMWCWGFLEGLADMNSICSWARFEEGNGFFCLPPGGLEQKQLASVVVKYLEENPKELHTPMRQVAIQAFQASYPCKGSR